MRRLVALLLSMLACTSVVAETYGPATTVSTPPTGACKTREVQIVSGSDGDDYGEQYCCIGWTPGGSAGTWTQCDIAIGGSGDIGSVLGCPSGDCGDIAATDGQSIDFSATPGAGWTTGEGIIISAQSTCSGTASAGTLCRQTSDGSLCMYTGSAWLCQQLGASGGDNVTVNGVATTNPNLVDSTSIECLYCTGAGSPDPECSGANQIRCWATTVDLSYAFVIGTTANRCARFNGSNQLVAASGDCASGAVSASGASGAIQVSAGSGSLTSSPNFTYTAEVSTTPASVNLDASATTVASDPRTMVNWHTDNARYSYWPTASGINQSSVPADPRSMKDWILVKSYNVCPLDGTLGRVCDNTWPNRDETWENFYWNGQDWFSEHISHFFDDNGSGSGQGLQTQWWHGGMKISGRCDAGSRAGLVCLPGGGPDNSPTGANYGCPGGTCVKHGTGAFTWNIDSWGYCTSQPKTRCQVNSQCPSSDCQRTEVNGAYVTLVSDHDNKEQNYFGGNRLLRITPSPWLFAGDIDINGDAAVQITTPVAPQAGDVDGSAYGLQITTSMDPTTEAGGKLAALNGILNVVDVNPNDNNSDVEQARGEQITMRIRPTGDNGSIGTGWRSVDGTDNSLPEVSGESIGMDYSEAIDTEVLVSAGSRYRRPIGGSGDSRRYYTAPIWIEDTAPATGAANEGVYGTYAMLVSPHTWNSAVKGNIACIDESDNNGGGDWNNGHFQASLGHLWFDNAGGTWRAKASAPSSGSDGVDLLAAEVGDISAVFDVTSGAVTDLTLGDLQGIDASTSDDDGMDAGEGLIPAVMTTCTGTATTGTICYGSTNDEICTYDGAAWDCIAVAQSGTVSVDPAAAPSNFEQWDTTTAVSGMTAADPCLCRPQTKFNDNIWVVGCKATSGNLVVSLYDNGTDCTGVPCNPAAQTVAYACGGPGGGSGGDITDVYGCASGDCGDIAMADADSLDMSGTPGAGWTTGEGLRLSQAATCTGTADAGTICYGTTNDEVCVYDGSTWDCQQLGIAAATTGEICKTIFIADGDANLALHSFSSGATVTQGWCQCIGPSCSTPAVISFEHDDGSPATIGGGNATCTARSSGDPTPVTFSGGENVMGTYDLVRIDEGAGTPTAGDQYVVCVK